jgi:hypothetical protein
MHPLPSASGVDLMTRTTILAAALCLPMAAHADDYHFTRIGSHVASNGATVDEYEVHHQGRSWHSCETAEGFEVDCQTGEEPR